MRTLAFTLIGLAVVMISGCDFNDPPKIVEIEINKTVITPGDEVAINVVAKDSDGDKLTYEYLVSAGEIVGSGSIVVWVAPAVPGTQFIKVTVSDGDKWDQRSLTVDVTAKGAAEGPYSFVIETESTTAAGFSGTGTLTQNGAPVQRATVEAKDCSTAKTAKATTNNQGQVHLGEMLGRIPSNHIVKTKVTHNGAVNTWCYQPGEKRWQATRCPAGC